MANGHLVKATGEVVLRVREKPFFLTSRGVAVICEVVDGDVQFGLSAVATFPGGAGKPQTEAVSGVEAALDRSVEPAREWPGLVFAAEAGSPRAESLCQLLVPGTLLTLTGPAAIPASHAD